MPLCTGMMRRTMGTESEARRLHFFLVSFPGQGHVNPLLRLGKLLASEGPLVTLSTCETTGKQIRQANAGVPFTAPAPVGRGHIQFEFFDDGWPDDDPRRLDLEAHLAQTERVGRSLLPAMLARHAQAGRPVSCLVNNPFFPWVADVAADLAIPSALLWVQSAASFSCYYHFAHRLTRFPTEEQPEIDVEIPTLPLLKHDEVPSFLHPSSPYDFLGRILTRQLGSLSESSCVLMETFDELEHATINHLSSLLPDVKPIGPLWKLLRSPAATVHANFIKADDGCLGWLDSKPPSSVVYVSFGSVVTLKPEQEDEIAFGLHASGLSFLWVRRPPPKESGAPARALPEGVLERGKAVEWAPQEAVLQHPAVACFVTHCGWNSTVEALSAGVPVVAFPQWGDQVIDAKFLVEVFKVGVRLCRGEAEGRVVGREEVRGRLLEACVGPKAAELKRRVLEWKSTAEGAVVEGGSSDRNLQAFVERERQRCSLEATAIP